MLPFVALPLPWVGRICVGTQQQEDIIVVSTEAEHGSSSSDGRYRLWLETPTVHAHRAGEYLWRALLQDVLATRFVVYGLGIPPADDDGNVDSEPSETRLFDAFVGGPDPPTLRDADGPPLQLADITPAGLAALQEGDAALASATHAVRGWSSFICHADHFRATSVSIRLRPFLRGADFALSRGDASLAPAVGSHGAPASAPAEEAAAGSTATASPSATPAHAAGPLALVGALNLRRRWGYWSNVSEGESGWLAKLRLAEWGRHG